MAAVMAEDPAQNDLAKGGDPVLRATKVAIVAHDPAYQPREQAQLNLEVLLEEVEREGGQTQRMPQAAAQPRVGRVTNYTHQANLIIKGRCVMPLRTRAGGETEALQLIERSVEESLEPSGWKVRAGSARLMFRNRRSQRGIAQLAASKSTGGPGGGKGKGGKGAPDEGKGKGKGGQSTAAQAGGRSGPAQRRKLMVAADAVAVALGTNLALTEAAIPKELTVTRPLTGEYNVLRGASTGEADYKIPGYVYYGDLGAPHKPGFYEKATGKELQQSKYRPKTDRQELEYEAWKCTIETATAGQGCHLFMEKTMRNAQTARICHPTKGCQKMPCALENRRPGAADIPMLTRMASANLQERLTRRAAEREEETRRQVEIAAARMEQTRRRQEEAEERRNAAALRAALGRR